MDMNDWHSVWLTLKLASVSTFFLLLLGTPLAWWLTQTKSKLKSVVASFVALPLVLPPSVLGFYLLISMGPDGLIGKLTESLGIGLLPFTFSGLVIGSVLYSLPFVVGPIQNSFEAMGKRPMEAAATLGASPFEAFTRVALPQAKSGLITASVFGFAHTVGEFGVVLMIGGNIPGETRVMSVAIYDYVEALKYGNAHMLSLGMLVFSFVILLLMYMSHHRPKVGP